MPESNEQHGIKDPALRVPKPEAETPETPLPDAVEVLAEEIKETLNYLVAAYKKKDKKRTIYRVGQISRQMVDLGRKCVDLPALVEEGGLILPEGTIS